MSVDIEKALASVEAIRRLEDEYGRERYKLAAVGGIGGIASYREMADAVSALAKERDRLREYGKGERERADAAVVEAGHLRAERDRLREAVEDAVIHVCQGCYDKHTLISDGTHQHPRGGIYSCTSTNLRAALLPATREELTKLQRQEPWGDKAPNAYRLHLEGEVVQKNAPPSSEKRASLTQEEERRR